MNCASETVQMFYSYQLPADFFNQFWTFLIDFAMLFPSFSSSIWFLPPHGSVCLFICLFVCFDREGGGGGVSSVKSLGSFPLSLNYIAILGRVVCLLVPCWIEVIGFDHFASSSSVWVNSVRLQLQAFDYKRWWGKRYSRYANVTGAMFFVLCFLFYLDSFWQELRQDSFQCFQTVASFLGVFLLISSEIIVLMNDSSFLID